MSSKHKCAVSNCNSQNNKLFRCPQSKNHLKKWKSILGVSENDFYVCELHFDAHFISYEKILSHEAVPTIFIYDKFSANQFCACCSNPISEGHPISRLHYEVYGILFYNMSLNGGCLCSNCNDKMIEISNFIKIVEDNRRNFEPLDVDMQEMVVKLEPQEFFTVEETHPYEESTSFFKTEYASNSEPDEYESESNDEKPQIKPKEKRVRNRTRKCDVCKFTTFDRDEFVNHIKIIHGTGLNPDEMELDLQLEIDDPHAFVGTKQSKECDICREVFTDRQLLIEHFKAHFDKDRIYVCPYCNKNCKGIVMLGFHKNLDHKIDKYYCICHRTYDKEVVMKRCKKVHQKTLIDTKYVCDECDSYVAFGDALRLGHHKTKVHGDGTKFWCTVCLKPYTSSGFKQCLKRHRDEISTININCPDCDSTFQYQRYKNHFKDRHCNETNEICEICGLGFPEKSSLNKHKRQKHSSSNTDISYECDFCGLTYSTKGHLLSHMAKHRYQEGNQCSICLKRNISRLEDHMEKNHPQNFDNGIRANPITNLYHCPLCVQNFNSMKFYERHVERNNCSIIGEYEVDVTKHVSSRTEGRFQCKLCKAVLKSIIRLKSHMNETHSGPKDCPICNKTYKNKRQLGKHIRNQHKLSMREFKHQ